MKELIELERKMIYAKYNGKKIKYWLYKKRYERMKKKIWK